MNNHPLNLTIRFLLEITALIVFGMWAWQKHEGFLRIFLVILLPLLAATVWGVFRVPNDPGPAPVAVSGIIRLLIEALFFGSALWMLKDMGADTFFWFMLVILLLHYVASYDRIILFSSKERN